MSDPVTGVVVSHGTLGAALVDAVHRITGESDALVAVSNDGCSASSLAQLVREAVGDRECVVFVDLPGGSCFTTAARLQHEQPALAIVAGVNLAMLIDFVHHRDTGLTDAAARAAEIGADAIRIVSG